MNRKKVLARYAHLRRLIVRAKEDADRWAHGELPLIMTGIKEKDGFDFYIYENAYDKFVARKKQEMGEELLGLGKPVKRSEISTPPASFTDIQLSRIANALESIEGILKPKN